MKRKNIKQITSIFGIVTVLAVIILAFLFRKRIEEYAMTGYIGVFIACFAATSTILLPAPGIFVVIQYSQFLNPVFVVLVGGLGTSLGELIGYLLGRLGQEVIEIDGDYRVLRWFDKNAYLTVFVFSLIPLPLFDIVGIAAGVERTNPVIFWICCFTGKVIKMGLYALLFAHVKELIPELLM